MRHPYAAACMATAPRRGGGGEIWVWQLMAMAMALLQRYDDYAVAM